MPDITLITVSGEDEPGICAALMAELAACGARVLDIGQATIHDTLSMGVLVETHGGADWREKVEAALAARFQCHLRVRFQNISLHEYESWVGAQGKPRYIVTLIARELRAEHLARLTEVLFRHGLNIDVITRLSGRLSLRGQSARAMACVEFSARGVPDDAMALRADLMDLAHGTEVDIGIQIDNVYRRNRRLVVFDMDSTLIQTEVIDELAAEAGAGAEVAAITESAMRGEIDFEVSLRKRVSLLEGLDESVLEAVAARLPVTPGAERLVSTIRQLGFKVALVSGGFTYFARRLQEKLGIDEVFANELEIADGKLTGRLAAPVVDAARKAEIVRDLAARYGIRLEQVVAVGDGANDLPMLGIAGLGIAFRAKPLVRQSADQSLSASDLDAVLYLLGLRDRESTA
jgi:phosphoserine phosphatase